MTPNTLSSFLLEYALHPLAEPAEFFGWVESSITVLYNDLIQAGYKPSDGQDIDRECNVRI